MAETFYAIIDGAQSGPFSLEELERMHERGELTWDALVCEEGALMWQPLADFLGVQAPPSLPELPSLIKERRPPAVQEPEPAGKRKPLLKGMILFFAGLATGSILLVAIFGFTEVRGWLLPERALPELPVLVSFRPSLLDQGQVAQIINQSEHKLLLNATFTNSFNQSREFLIRILPNDYAEFGWMEGWRFDSGHRIMLKHPEFRDGEWRVP